MTDVFQKVIIMNKKSFDNKKKIKVNNKNWQNKNEN